MALPAAVPVTTAVGSIGGSLVNNISSNKRIDKENQRIEDAINTLVYNPRDFFTNYEYYKDPELYETYLQESNAYDDISLDPSVLSAQNKALDELINLSEAKGLNAIDQQALQEIVNEENRNLQAQNDAILQDAMQRGVYGSGLEMAQRLQNAQSSANRMSNRDMDVMSQAQQRALDALSSYGNLASNMRNQDYNEQAQKAAAANAINQFNVNQMTNANRGNVDNRNQVSQLNTGVQHKQQDSNVRAAGDKWAMDLDKKKLQTGQADSTKSDIRQLQQQNQQMLGNFDTALGSAFDSADKKKQY